MILIPHIIVGAVIGAKIKHFGWIIILGLFSHLLLDKIPHWDYLPKGIKRLAQERNYKGLLIVVFIIMVDGLIGLAIVFLIIWQKDMINLNNLQFILVGILASIFPDIILGIAGLVEGFFSKFEKITTKYINFHEKVLHCSKHIRKPTLLGVSTQILISAIAILILLI